MNKITLNGHSFELTHLDKLFFPKITKKDVVNYYLDISPQLLTHIEGRPLMMQRMPEGIFGESFYQKNSPEYFPEWIKKVKVPIKEDGFTNFAVCQNQATLVYLANQGVLVFHTWLSRSDKLDYPDKLIFDLDPSNPKDFQSVIKAAFLTKELLQELGLISYVMTTGSHGLHVLVPLNRAEDFKSVKAFADGCARILLFNNPDLFTLELRKAKRGKKIFIDTLRDQFGATAVCPYSIRPYPSAPVATPLHWEELNQPKINSQTYNINNIFERLKKMDDPWKDVFKNKKSLKRASQRVNKILKNQGL